MVLIYNEDKFISVMMSMLVDNSVGRWDCTL